MAALLEIKYFWKVLDEGSRRPTEEKRKGSVGRFWKAKETTTFALTRLIDEETMLFVISSSSILNIGQSGDPCSAMSASLASVNL